MKTFKFLNLVATLLFTCYLTNGIAQGTRTEKDLLGEKQISNDAYYGVQTARALENFQVSGVLTKFYPDYVRAYAMVKLAAAQANTDVGRMSKDKLAMIEKACKAIIDGKYHDQFLVDLYNGGAGTSANMNANEVIANVALEMGGHKKGEYTIVEPHDDLNMGQSTNDVYPTAIHVALLLHNDKVVKEAKELSASFHKIGDKYSKVLKMGRTEGQDAVPMTVGQEFHGFGNQIDAAIDAGKIRSIFIRGKYGCHGYRYRYYRVTRVCRKCATRLAEITGKPMHLLKDLIAATSSMQGFVMYSGALKNFCVTLSKISSDLIFLARAPVLEFLRSIYPLFNQDLPSCREK